MSEPKKLFWYRDSNFGDALNSIFLPDFGVPVSWTPSEDAEIIGIGSILGWIPASFAGIVLGAGFMYAEQQQSFSKADLQIVRGRHTAERCSAPPSTCLGDPGLLVSRFLDQAAPTRHTLGLIPHYVDQQHPAVLRLADRYPDEILVIDIRGTAQQVLTEISSCAAIASSSLHGLIAADALKKPNLWLTLSNNVSGGEFKYRDYYSAYLPDNRIRSPFALQGDESLSELLDQSVTPGNEVLDAASRIEEVVTGLFPRN